MTPKAWEITQHGKTGLFSPFWEHDQGLRIGNCLHCFIQNWEKLYCIIQSNKQKINYLVH